MKIELQTLIIVMILSLIIIYLYGFREKYSAWDFVQPGKPKDLISNYNQNLGNCLLRRLDDKRRVCNSVVGVVPFPQLSYDPKNFTDF